MSNLKTHPPKPQNFWHALPRPILALAPMAGVTDRPFRLLCKEFGADVVYTEMISAAGLFYNDKKTAWFLKTSAVEQPAVAQIFGFEPEHFKIAARAVETSGFAGLDLNFGCPARKVVKNFSGCALMDDPARARAILEATLSSTSLPVSIKIRARKGQTTASQFLSALKDLPISAVMLHARSFEQGFSGELDWDEAEKVRAICAAWSASAPSVSAPPASLPAAINHTPTFLINGGITDPASARAALKRVKADGIGLARGVYGRPWLFAEIKSAFAPISHGPIPVPARAVSPSDSPASSRPPISTPSIPTGPAALKKFMLRHAELALKDGYYTNLIELRKHFLWYAAGFPGAKDLRQELTKVKTLADLEKALSD